MVFDFLLDYMHLVLLGAVRRLCVRVWQGKNKTHRLSREDLTIIDKRIAYLGKQLPREFHRTGSPLTEAKSWKAVEFRTFLLTLL